MGSHGDWSYQRSFALKEQIAKLKALLVNQVQPDTFFRIPFVLLLIAVVRKKRSSGYFLLQCKQSTDLFDAIG